MGAIDIRKVDKFYGKTQVVHTVDLSIDDGSFVVILGPSGCGKSTLLRMIAGLEAISAGEIAIGGRVVNRLEPRERGCAMVFQNYALYPHMTVAENIGYALKVAGIAKAERQKRVRDVARSVGLDDFLDRKPGQLSGGQRQRVAMGRAMIREPKVFLFDEPLSNLDAKLRVQMRLEIRRLHQRLGTTSVFVTHDQVEAMTLADQIVVMNAGRIEQVGTPGVIYAKPATLFVAGFIGSPPMNLIPATVSAMGEVKAADETMRTPVLGINGNRIVLGLRAEDIVLAPAGRHQIRAEFVERLGSAQLIHGHFAGQDFVIQCPATVAIAPGQTLRFDLIPTLMHAFDAETGKRLEPVSAPSPAIAPVPA
jgi:sn-glycerol 3-phosphate transport system ATP-binding protein